MSSTPLRSRVVTGDSLAMLMVFSDCDFHGFCCKLKVLRLGWRDLSIPVQFGSATVRAMPWNVLCSSSFGSKAFVEIGIPLSFDLRSFDRRVQFLVPLSEHLVPLVPILLSGLAWNSEMGRIRFRRVRLQIPNSVSFLALTELRGENSVSSS